MLLVVLGVLGSLAADAPAGPSAANAAAPSTSAVPGASGADGAPEPQPWWERDSCREAARLIQEGELGGVQRLLLQLEHSQDPDEIACGTWLRVSHAEMQIGIDGGLTEANIKYREFYLSQMIGFAHQYGAQAQRFADFEMEAWTRRVRTYFEEGRKMDAVGAARAGFQLLQARHGPTSPTVDFVSGTFDSAYGHASGPLRLLFRMAGINGDLQRGYQEMSRLYEGHTLYRYEAMYVARYFTTQMQGSPFGTQQKWMLALHQAYPGNPQYLFDLALALREARECKKLPDYYGGALERMRKEPEVWSALMRAKLYWAAGECAADVGDRGRAKEMAAACKAQRADPWNDPLGDLLGRLD